MGCCPALFFGMPPEAWTRPLKHMPAPTATAALQSILGYTFTNPALLQLALTHRSVQLEEDEDHNEKLEFLGDAVLGLVMSDLLFRQFPQYREGDLSKRRASLVNAEVLAVKARTLSLGDWLRMGRGEERSGGREKPSLLAAAYEAVLGAVYLDGGFAPVTRLVATHFTVDLQETERLAAFDSKTRLQEITQKVFKQIPSYEVVTVNGPDHEKRFVSQVSIAGELYGRGEGRSKKRAHQAAASQTLELLKHKNLASLKDG